MATIFGKNPGGETLDYNDGVTDYADVIVGNAGNDIIHAGGGNDTLKGGGGADVLDGGSGNDTATYEQSSAGVTVNLVSGQGYGGSAEGDTLTSIENLYGSSYNDSLTGDSHDNVLNGAAGNDTLKGGGGTDTLIGGAGNDWMQIDSVDDHAAGGEGIDTLALNSSVGMNVNLGSGNMAVNTYNSPDTYPTGYGYHDHHGPFTPYGPSPQLPDGQPQITDVENAEGSGFNDKLVGSEVANTLSGNAGNDILIGLGGNDIISGGTGKDYIFGGMGADMLTGGADADKFIWTGLDESTFGAGKPQDVITDFQQGTDHIDLTTFHLALSDVLVQDNHVADGVNYSYVGVDANHNGAFDDGEFAIAVKMDPGATLHANDLLF